MYGERNYTLRDWLNAAFCWHKPKKEGSFFICECCTYEWPWYDYIRQFLWLITGRLPK